MTSTNTRSRLHIVMSHVATLALLVFVLASLDLVPMALLAVAAIAMMASILVMFATRNSDEWIASLWTAGASAGFIGAIAWLLFLPFFEGFFDGLTGTDDGQSIPAQAAAIVALGCFVIAFNIKRLRGV